MGKASISIAVTGSYNGAALERAEKRLDSIAIKTAGASKSLGGMSSQLVEHGSQLASLGGDIYNTGAQIEGAGQKMMGVSAIAVGLGVVTGAAAVKIDTALTGVRKTVDGTDEQYQQLKDFSPLTSRTGTAPGHNGPLRGTPARETDYVHCGVQRARRVAVRKSSPAARGSSYPLLPTAHAPPGRSRRPSAGRGVRPAWTRLPAQLPNSGEGDRCGRELSTNCQPPPCRLRAGRSADATGHLL